MDPNQGNLTFGLELISICCAEDSSVRGRGRARGGGTSGNSIFSLSGSTRAYIFPVTIDAKCVLA